MKRACLVAAVAVALCLFVRPAVAQPAGPEVNEANVNKAIQRAVEYIYSAANKDGIWDDLPKPEPLAKPGEFHSASQNWGGKTALALLALSTAGQQNDPRFKKALDWLMGQHLVGTYTLGLRLQLIAHLVEAEKYRPVLTNDARLLEQGARKVGQGIMWQYVPKPLGNDGEPGDFSNVNYAVLGLWAAGDERYEVDVRYWVGLEKSYVVTQDKEGGFSYRTPPPAVNPEGHYAATGSMTTAGIASLYLILDRAYIPRVPMGAYRKTPAYASIEKGLEWMGKNFSAGTNPRHADWFNTYYFYNCERVGAAAGLKYFGTHDWFRGIAATLLRWQDAQGAINGQTPDQYGGKLVDTSYGLLFLAKGSAPVVFNKLQHAGDWDNHLRELAGLTDWLARQSERPANWQVVNLKVPPEDLTDCRLLYVAGIKALEFTAEEKAKLKRYVELGGMLVFHPDTGSRAFTDSADKLLGDLWPGLELTSVDMAADGLGKVYMPITDRSIRLRKLAAPTRVLAVVVEGDMATAWEKRMFATGKQKFDLGANLHYYVNDRALLKEAPSKLTYFAEVFRRPMAATDKTIALARINYGNNPHRWDPEPLAFERLAREMAARHKVKLEVKTMAPEGLAGAGVKIAHLTGVDATALSEEQWKAVVAWLAAGGTLIADQAGGPKEKPDNSFDQGFRNLVTGQYGKDAFRSMAAGGVMLAGMDKVGHRNVMGVRRRTMPPRLEVVMIGQRPAIIYSQLDMTCGLLGNPNPLVSGLADEGAVEVFSRLLMNVK